MTRSERETGPGDWLRSAVLAAGLVGVIALVTPTFLGSRRRPGNEIAAIGALKTISTSQSLYRETDKTTGDERYAASLAELGSRSLVDPILATGTKQGYTFRVVPSRSQPEFRWAATAGPALPGVTGERYFATNHQGVTFYTTRGPIPIDPETCAIPPGPRPLGQ